MSEFDDMAAGAEERRADADSAVGLNTSEYDVLNRDTDRANGQEFARMFDGRVIWTPEADWLIFDGRRWSRDVARQRDLLIGELTDSLRRRAGTQRDEDQRTTRSRVRRLESARGLLGALSFAAPLMSRSIVEFDTNHYLLNCPNGTLDLRTGELRGHSSLDYITRLCPTPYDSKADDEVWNRVLIEALDNDPDKVTAFHRFIGYALTGLTTEKKFMVCHGPTNGGKSTITEPFMHVLGVVDDGGYATTWDADVVQANSNVNRAEKLNKIRGARLVLVGELQKGSRMADNFVKQVTGGDTMDARALYRSSYSYRPTAKLLMATNYVPQSADPAVHGRLLLLPLRNVPKVIDKSLKAHLETDPGAHRAMLAWAVRGCREWFDEKTLGATPWLAGELRAFVLDSNPVEHFLEQCMDRDPDDRTSSIHVDLAYNLYATWALENVTKPLKRRPFEHALGEAGYEKCRIPAKGGTMRWCGMKPKPLEDLPSCVANALWAYGQSRHNAVQS